MKKETFEWIHSWQDYTLNDDLKRVLLIGDSITYGYQEKVREKLKGICYVDYLSTSYAIDTKIYNTLVEQFALYNKYDLIHFNHGLHGKHISKKSYKSKIEKLLVKLFKNSKVSLANITIINKEGNRKPDREWMKRVQERNEAIEELAEKYNLTIDDLNSVSKEIKTEDRYSDGTHYLESGYEIFANKVSEFIKENL